MKHLQMLLNQVYLKVCQVPTDLQDDDWNYIVFEFSMNFTLDSIRTAYFKEKEEKEKMLDNDTLRALGYTDEDLLKAH